MESKTQQGYLVLADISGFTSYLAGVELDHAHEILGDLLETIVDNFKPILTLSKLEGDAVFAYAPESKVERGETVLEVLEATYMAFRNRLEAVRRRTTCECNACRSLPRLDLKFMVHYGRYVLQEVAGRSELLGSDVNLAHRLLKNQVGEQTGWVAYALFTQAALERMKVWPDCALSHAENYDHLGEVTMHTMDLHKRYKELMAEKRLALSKEEADIDLVLDVAASPAVTWDWLHDQRKREIWLEHTTWTVAARPGGRTGQGARNHCAHGKSVSVEEIWDWRPFTYYSCQDTMDAKGRTRTFSTYELTALEGGRRTRLEVRIVLKMGRLPRLITRPLCRMMMLKISKFDRGLTLMAHKAGESDAGPAMPEMVAAMAAA